MNDYLQQLELPSEALQTMSSLICSVDFYGDGQPFLCIASATSVRVFSLTQPIANLSIQEKPLMIAAVKQQDINEIVQYSEHLMVVFERKIEVYSLYEEQQLKLELLHNVEEPALKSTELQIIESNENNAEQLKKALKEHALKTPLSITTQRILSIPEQNLQTIITIAKQRHPSAIVAAQVIGTTDQDGRRLTGHSVCYVTENNTLIMLDPLMKKQLINISLPSRVIMLQTEGIVQMYQETDPANLTQSKREAEEAKIQLIEPNEPAQADSESKDKPSGYRIIMQLANGSIQTVHSGRLSSNQIFAPPTAHVWRLGNSVLVAIGSQVRRLNPRGRVEEIWEFPHQCSCLIPLQIPYGSCFKGVLCMDTTIGVGTYISETGVGKLIDFGLGALETVKYCSIGQKYVAVIVKSDNKIVLRPFGPKCNPTDSTQNKPKNPPPFDVETMGGPEQVQDQAQQKQALPLFQQSRATARNIVLQALLSHESKIHSKVAQVVSHDLVYSAGLEGQVPHFTLVVEVHNTGKQMSEPFMAMLQVPEHLEPESSGILIPALPSGCKHIGYRKVDIRDFESFINGTAISKKSSEIMVRFGSNAGRPDGVCIVQVPEILV